jgi:hypothetical protein
MSEEFKNRLLVHAKTAVERAGRAQNEEATKQFLIIPFLQLLGYDPLDPDDVIPEADASFSDKFKNRVDYAISEEGGQSLGSQPGGAQRVLQCRAHREAGHLDRRPDLPTLQRH